MEYATKILDEIEAVVEEAEKSLAPRGVLERGRELLARVVIEGVQLDRDRVGALLARCARNYKKDSNPRAVLWWAPFLGACADYLREGVVGMRDGRLATPDGWDYSNCEPVEVTVRVSRETYERLDLHVSTLTDAPPGADPTGRSGKHRTAYDDHFDEVVEEAIRQLLDQKEEK